MDILNMYYPSGPFRLGIDNEILYVVPAEFGMDENIKILEENIAISEIPAYLNVLGSPEQIYVWVDEQTSEYEDDEKDALEVEIVKNEEKTMDIQIEKPDLEEDISFLTAEIKKVKSENVRLETEVDRLGKFFKSMDTSLADFYKQAGGDLKDLPQDMNVRFLKIIEFLKAKLK